MLPNLCEAVPHEFKCQLVINSINTFMNDSYPIVRFTLAEILGEVIVKFLPPDWEISGNSGNVPEVIINFFLSLGDNSNHQPTQHHQIENDCTLVCARNFPAVLLTAGASHWDSLFRDKYKRLAKDHQIKVRSSFAHSLHAIAKIIGPVRTLNDLVHIFALYLMDVDEVKSGVMEHLADFLGVLDAKVRSEYLPVLMEIWEGVVTNRAFRKLLVDQLALITPLCTLGQFVEHVLPLVLYACQDEVAIIRDSAAKVFPVTLGLIRKEPSGYAYSVDQLITGLHFLMESPLYRQRLLFANIGHLLLSGGLSYQAFVTYLLDRLLVLAEDKVVNVRIAVSRCLATLCSKASQSIESQQRLVTQHEKLNDAIRYLELESDADVAYYMRITVAQMKSMVVGSTLAQHPALVTPDHFPHQQNQHQPMEVLLSELPSPPCSPDGKPFKPTTPLVYNVVVLAYRINISNYHVQAGLPRQLSKVSGQIKNHNPLENSPSLPLEAQTIAPPENSPSFPLPAKYSNSASGYKEVFCCPSCIFAPSSPRHHFFASNVILSLYDGKRTNERTN
ncbi:hypothetical protein, partial, partial [Absidia glauca]